MILTILTICYTISKYRKQINLKGFDEDSRLQDYFYREPGLLRTGKYMYLNITSELKAERIIRLSLSGNVPLYI